MRFIDHRHGITNRPKGTYKTRECLLPLPTPSHHQMHRCSLIKLLSCLDFIKKLQSIGKGKKQSLRDRASTITQTCIRQRSWNDQIANNYNSYVNESCRKSHKPVSQLLLNCCEKNITTKATLIKESF